jgi:putative lipoprotein
MKPYSLLCVLCLVFPVSAYAADDWNGPDKTRHFALSAMIGTLSAMHFESKWKAFGVALIPGLLKEVHDGSQADNHFSGKDLVADAVGAAVGVQIGHWLVTRDGIGYQAAF